MNATQRLDRSTQISVPTELSAAESKLVYLYVAAADGATVDDLQAGLDLKQITLFPVLHTLEKRGLIERTGEAYVPNAS